MNDEYEVSKNMAFVDFLPVILFGIIGTLAFLDIRNILLLVGVVLCMLAGICKAGWKLILAFTSKEINVLPMLFHIVMPIGFVLMIISMPMEFAKWQQFLHTLLTLPSIIFLIIGCFGMSMMVIFTMKLDSKKASSNWIEQVTNIVSQLSFVMAIVLTKI